MIALICLAVENHLPGLSIFALKGHLSVGPFPHCPGGPTPRSTATPLASVFQEGEGHVGQNPWTTERSNIQIWLWLSKPMGSHFGVGEFTIRFRTFFSGDWDVHWGYGISTHGQYDFWISCFDLVAQQASSKCPDELRKQEHSVMARPAAGCAQ